MKTKNGFRESYNAQAAADSRNGIIVATDVSTSGSDAENYSTMVDEVKSNVGEEIIKKSKFVFDAGYLSTENIVKAEEDKIDAYIAPEKDKNYYCEEKKDHNEEKKITAENCIVSSKEDSKILTCPGGRSFSAFKYSKKGNGRESYYVKVPADEICSACKHYNNCKGYLKNKKKEKRFWIEKIKLDNLELIDAFHSKMNSKEGKKIYSRRMPTIERAFGCIKTAFRYRETYRRGLIKLKTEWNLICSAYNLRRMFNLSCR